MLAIRPARPLDASALAPLLAQLGYDPGAEHVKRWLCRHDPQRDFVWVAELQQQPVGLIALHLIPLLHAPGELARITALVVSEDARGQGVATRLVEHAEQHARARGAARMEVTSAGHRAGAHAFYLAQGYAEPGQKRFLKDL